MTNEQAKMRARAYLALMRGKTIQIECTFGGTRSCGDGDLYALQDPKRGVMGRLCCWDDMISAWCPVMQLPETMTAFRVLPDA